MIKAIMISDKPRYCAKIMNGEKTIEVRRNKALASAIQKLIGENGYADIYVYCTKELTRLYGEQSPFIENHLNYFADDFSEGFDSNNTGFLNGKVIFKFRCYKVEEIKYDEKSLACYTECMNYIKLQLRSCLDLEEIHLYLKGKKSYAIHISDLEIFDKPKELCEFESTKQRLVDVGQIQPILQNIRLTKAPQNFCYIEVEDND